jgi:hypothetical protein
LGVGPLLSFEDFMRVLIQRGKIVINDNITEQVTDFQYLGYRIHFISSLSYDRLKASSKASFPHSTIQSFLLQMRVSSPFLKVIQ